jgi:hypothetical protein
MQFRLGRIVIGLKFNRYWRGIVLVFSFKAGPLRKTRRAALLMLVCMMMLMRGWWRLRMLLRWLLLLLLVRMHLVVGRRRRTLLLGLLAVKVHRRRPQAGTLRWHSLRRRDGQR